VTMHEYARLAECLRDERIVYALHADCAPRVEAQVALAKPLGKERDLTAQQRLVVGRQEMRMPRASRLNADERGNRVGIEPIDIAALFQLGEIGTRAEIGIEQKAFVFFALEHARRIHTD